MNLVKDIVNTISLRQVNKYNVNEMIIIASHVFSPGTSQALYGYCKHNNIDVQFIGHRLFGNYFSWSFGFIDTIYRVLKNKRSADIFVGFNNLNALAGIILQKTGKVKKTVYHTVDYSPRRFNNKLLNKFYHWLDHFCVKNCDIVWNSSSIMKVDPIMKAREKAGYNICLRKKQIQVPDGCDKFPVIPFSKINRNLVGYVGHIKEDMGVNLMIDGFIEVLKNFPNAELLIIGSGPLEKVLMKKAEKFKNIKFIGYVGEIETVYEKLSTCAFAVAPYKHGGISQYSDPGKVKNYLSVGLPIIITDEPIIAREIEKERCGLVIKDNKKQFVQAVTKLLKNKKLLVNLRNNTKTLRKKYSWDTIFDKALRITNKV
ncbi:MAG: glycosyltransferase [Candidatus Roizmanbacteria bacterium]|nr:glycosyltransferase [Candidatus Roizmanbacteria bacterium]